MEDSFNRVNTSYFWAHDYEKGWNYTTYFSFFNDFGRQDTDMPYVEFTFIMFLSFCSFLVNFLLILFFLTKKELRTEQHMFTISIMVSSIIVVPFAVLIGSTRLSESGWMFGSVACKTTLYILVATAFVKIWLMTLISVDRYLRVVHSHHRYIGRKLSVILILSAWILPATTVAGMTYPNAEVKYIPDLYGGVHICTVAFEWHPTIRSALIYFGTLFVVEFILPTTIMIVCYTLIMKKIRQSRKALLKHTNTKTSLNVKSRERSLKSNLHKRRTTVILITIVTLFQIMWLPLFILLAVITLDEILSSYQLTSRWIVGQTCVLLLNTLIEPFLYSFTTSKVRNELKRTLRTIKPFKANVVHSASYIDDTSTQLNMSETCSA